MPNSAVGPPAPLASQQPPPSSLATQVVIPLAPSHANPDGHVLAALGVQVIVHFIAPCSIAHIPESQSAAVPQVEPSPMGPNGCAMQPFAKHSRPVAQSASPAQYRSLTCDVMNACSASVRVSAPAP